MMTWIGYTMHLYITIIMDVLGIFYILAITKESLYNCNRLFDLLGFVILIWYPI